jgi:membrane protease YdiL (CAAX protease family)
VEYLRSLSPKTEFVIVITVAFGLSILGSVLSLVSAPDGPAISDAGLRSLVVYEISILALLGAFLWTRGWTRKQLGLAPDRTDALASVVLGLTAYLACFITMLVLGNLVPGGVGLPAGFIEDNMNLGTVLIASVVNGVFEEVFVCGYVIAALRRSRGVWFAINVSIGLRVSYHLYQGAAGVISIVPLGLVLAYWFARTGRLWPVAIAHCLFDILALWAHISD